MVQFCPRCSNILAYSLIIDDNKKILRYQCSSCQHPVEIEGLDDSLEKAILFTQETLNAIPDRQIRPEMCNDRTLPHATDIPCPNGECPTNDKNNKELFKKYDSVFFHYNEDMKLAYICCECQVVWKVD